MTMVRFLFLIIFLRQQIENIVKLNTQTDSTFKETKKKMSVQRFDQLQIGTNQTIANHSLESYYILTFLVPLNYGKSYNDFFYEETRYTINKCIEK